MQLNYIKRLFIQASEQHSLSNPLSSMGGFSPYADEHIMYTLRTVHDYVLFIKVLSACKHND